MTLVASVKLVGPGSKPTKSGQCRQVADACRGWTT
jgi:hypothetical protein